MSVENIYTDYVRYCKLLKIPAMTYEAWQAANKRLWRNADFIPPADVRGEGYRTW